MNCRASPDAEDIHHRQQNDNHDARQILRIKPDIHIAQFDGANVERVEWRYMADMPYPVIGGHGRKEVTKKFSKGHAHRGDGAGLNHKE